MAGTTSPLLRRLAERAELFVSDVVGLGRPTLKQKRQLRFGRSQKISVKLPDGVFYDHSAETGGHLVQLLARERGLSEDDAWKRAREWLDGAAPDLPERTEPAAEPLPLVALPTAPRPLRPRDAQTLAPSLTLRAIYPYLTGAGAFAGAVVRYERHDGSKLTLTVTWCRNTETGALLWAFRGLPAPRPIYGLPALLARPHATVLLVEGEKTADAGGELYPDLVTITWAGGSSAVDHTDWAPLRGRHIVGWHDADHPAFKHGKLRHPGYRAIVRIAALTRARAASFRIVSVPTEPIDLYRLGIPDGWDIADRPPPGWTPAYCRELIDTAPPYDPRRHPQNLPVAPFPDEARYHDHLRAQLRHRLLRHLQPLGS